MPLRLSIKVIPRASRNGVAGWVGDCVKIKLLAPPSDGRANEALCELLADLLHLPKRSISLVVGEKSRQKIVQIEGLTLDEAKLRLRAKV